MLKFIIGLLIPIQTFWPATAAGWMGLAGGATGLAGSIMKLFNSGGDQGYSANDHGDSIKEHWQTTFRMAKQHGIHPLVAMGISPSSVPMSSGYMDKSTGDKLMDLGQSIRRLPEDPEKKANIRIKNAQASLLEKQLKDKTIQGQSDLVKQEELPLESPIYSSGDKDGASKPLYQLYRHPDNTLLKIPSEDAADFLSESVIDSAIIQTKRWFQNFTRRFANLPVGPKFEKASDAMRDELNQMEDFLRSHKKIRPDEYLQFSPTMGLPVVSRFKGKKKTLFRDGALAKSRVPRYSGIWFRRNKF